MCLSRVQPLSRICIDIMTTTNTLDHCTRISVKSFLPYIALLALQCAALHPSFAHSRLARWLRMGIMPLNFCWWITLPFRVCAKPTDSTGNAELFVGISSIYMATKSLEWGFVEGACYKRPLKTVNGVHQWEKVKRDDESYKKMQESEPCDGFQLFTWTLLQMVS